MYNFQKASKVTIFKVHALHFTERFTKMRVRIKIFESEISLGFALEKVIRERTSGSDTGGNVKRMKFTGGQAGWRARDSKILNFIIRRRCVLLSK